MNVRSYVPTKFNNLFHDSQILFYSITKRHIKFFWKGRKESWRLAHNYSNWGDILDQKDVPRDRLA
jgi:hypothetical protein